MGIKFEQICLDLGKIKTLTSSKTFDLLRLRDSYGYETGYGYETAINLLLYHASEIRSCRFNKTKNCYKNASLRYSL